MPRQRKRERDWYEDDWDRPTTNEIVEAAIEQLKRDLAEVRAASLDTGQHGEGKDG